MALISMLMGLWLATSFTGNFVAGYLGTFWEGMAKDQFFMMIAAIAKTWESRYIWRIGAAAAIGWGGIAR